MIVVALVSVFASFIIVRALRRSGVDSCFTRPLFFLLFFGIMFILGMAFNSINYSLPSSPSVQPTPIARTYPTVTQDPCYTWAQITLDMEGDKVCVEGAAAQVYPVYGSVSTRINFTTVTNTFFLISTTYVYFYWQDGTRHDLVAGNCVQATEVVRVFDDGYHQIPYMQISNLYRCEP